MRRPGGGYNSLTKVLARNSDYTLIDFVAHGLGSEAGSAYKYFRENNINLLEEDWMSHNFTNEYYDIVIANDIFPDVDQRMELFIDTMLPICKEIRLVITYYNTPQYYTTKRIDDTEVMTFLSWDGEITSLKLKKYLLYMRNTDTEELDQMKGNKDSIYRNGRQVSYVVLSKDD